MELSPFGVRATAGTLRASGSASGSASGPRGGGVTLPHAWTDEGVVAGPATNGAQVLHLAVALCVLNDTYREARARGVQVDGVAVEADGGFDDDWRSTGITYAVTLDSPASEAERSALLAAVEQVAEVPRALRAGARVTRG